MQLIWVIFMLEHSTLLALRACGAWYKYEGNDFSAFLLDQLMLV